jgi:hypothetical protein
MHLRMQRLDPSVHHFRKTRQLRNVGDFQPRGWRRTTGHGSRGADGRSWVGPG